MTTTKRDEFKAAFRSMHMGMVGCCAADDARTMDELISAVRTELDLTEEGQDGTSRRNLKPLRNWLKKWAN